jgi:hypothetical protein
MRVAHRINFKHYSASSNELLCLVCVFEYLLCAFWSIVHSHHIYLLLYPIECTRLNFIFAMCEKKKYYDFRKLTSRSVRKGKMIKSFTITSRVVNIIKQSLKTKMMFRNANSPSLQLDCTRIDDDEKTY